MKELTQRKVRVTKLLSREDTKSHPEEPYGPDYLWSLVHNTQNIEMPLIIFTTPELLSTCTEEKGPIQALAKQGKMSLIVLDEFDYIDECHQQHRNAYTTIVPDLKRAVEHLHIPFLYLSATGSNYRMHDILFTISNLRASSKPILVQTEQILPDHHIYRGM
jgi:superfamily II DNA helicase RecQ